MINDWVRRDQMSSYGSRDELETSMIKSHGFLGHLALCFPRSAFWSEYYAKCGLVECEIGLTHDGQYVALTPASMAKHLGSPTKNAIPNRKLGRVPFYNFHSRIYFAGNLFSFFGSNHFSRVPFQSQVHCFPNLQSAKVYNYVPEVEKSRSLPFLRDG